MSIFLRYYTIFFPYEVFLMSPTEAASTPAKPKPDKLVPYKQVEARTLNLHLFLSDSTGIQKSAKPILVFFHGGGWNGGGPAQFYSQSAFLRDRGIICISAEYRVEEQDGTTPLEAIQDAFDAIRFVRSHAKDWGGDPDRIAAAGGSAGGHLAAATASLTAEDLAGTPVEASKARPDLLILFNPVSDNGPGEYGHERLGDRWREASPAHNLHADLPPILIMLGDNDRLIPVKTAEKFSSNLDALDVPNQLVIYPGGEHGFFNSHKYDGLYYGKTMAETERFLVKNGWLYESTCSRPPA
jgi:acetyl esterase/lipase